MKPVYEVERNHCDCHPETCCCPTYVLMKDSKVFLRSNDRKHLEEVKFAMDKVSEG